MKQSPVRTRVIELVAQGYSDKQIAAIQGTSVSTIKKHVAKAIKQLKARNRTHVAVIYVTDKIEKRFINVTH